MLAAGRIHCRIPAFLCPAPRRAISDDHSASDFCISLCAAWVVGFGYLIVAIKRLPVFRESTSADARCLAALERGDSRL